MPLLGGIFISMNIDLVTLHIMMESRNYESISPSAKSLLLMKAYTNIPYARETAALMSGPEVFGLDFEHKDFYFWLRVMHFESRYWSIDQLLQKEASNNIFELSSGYSLRGLDMCRKQNVFYIDTDLPDVIKTKQWMMHELKLGKEMKGQLELASLNALDQQALNSLATGFPAGPVTVVNEGLLMYLGLEEKKQLCQNIRGLLATRGGSWITADVYIKRPVSLRDAMPKTKAEAEFQEQHNIEENKFDSYEDAENFFNEQGLEKSEEAAVDFQQLSVMPHLLDSLPPELRNRREPPPKIQATWRLQLKN